MKLRLLPVLAGLLVAVAAGFGASVLAYPFWKPWLFPDPAKEPAEEHEHANVVKLSPQAQASLRLEVKPVRPGPYRRTVTMPGTVIELPGKSDHAVTAPVAGVIEGISVYPWDRVQPKQKLFTLKLVSEALHTSQVQLYKTARELDQTRQRRERLGKSFASGSVPEAQLIELDFQERRLGDALKAGRLELAARGLNQDQIDAVIQGQFLTRMTILVPDLPADEKPAGAAAPRQYEVQELKVTLGEQVQAGQMLCYLTDHQSLFIEGRALKPEVPLLEEAAHRGWPVRAEAADESERWRPLGDDLKVHFLANVIDAPSQTFPFYVPLSNQHHEYRSGGRTYRLWRFRPGQRVRLYVPVEQLDDVYVLPAEAVVREGPEAYVFRENGELFERLPVTVRHADRQNVVLANDGSLLEGYRLAHNGAAQLNRVLKTQGEGEGHGHHHHHH